MLFYMALWCCLYASGACVSYPKTLPCTVHEKINSSMVTVDCTQRGLTFIPVGIPRETTNLTLTINHIPSLNSSSFHGLENLTEIDMRCNCVPIKIGPKDRICTESVTIEKNTFASIKNLRALYLDGNQLTSIPRGLPPNLILLSLEVNHIYYISKANFTELRNVQKLYLGQNCYFRNPCNASYDIEDGTFTKLQNLTLLSLKSNNLSYIPHDLPTSLRELHLYNNNFQSVTDEDFKNLTNLEILDISGNCPRCYNAPFPCTPCPNNAALNISHAAFKMLTKLKTLNLHSNSLTHVPSEWFETIRDLKVLDLSSNFLAERIGSNHFLPKSLNRLVELDLSFNFQLQRYPQMLRLSRSFAFLKSLQVLRLQGFVFQQLGAESIDPLKDLPNLQVLDLGTNFIKNTNLSILMELKSFKIINLSNNKISSPSDGQDPVGFAGEAPLQWSPMSAAAQFQDNEVREVHYFRYDEYARKCKYKGTEHGDVPSFLQGECIKFGKTLDVSRNNIFFLHSRFLNLSELRCLNLSGNAMSQSLNGSEFTYLTNLQYLDFSMNRLDLLYSTAFQELKNLIILDISKNSHYFQSEGLTHMLNFTKNLKNLKTLLMNNNQISTSTNTELESESLQRLEFRDNRLDMLWRDGDTRYIKYFKKLLNLTHLDISQNNLDFIPDQVFSNLPDKLSELLIKDNKLKSFPWKKLKLLRSLQVLDLSRNSLDSVPVLSDCTTYLKKLNLHGNHIFKLPPDFLKDASNLKYLDLSDNLIQHIEKSSFPDDVMKQMDKLLLHRNKFLCSCNASWFVSWLNSTSVIIPKLATEVTCAAPGAQQGLPVITADLQTCQHNSLSIILYTFMTSLILVLLAISVSSHLFLWDVWYIYHFCRAKVKGYGRLYSPSSVYDAFIMYDKEDYAVSEWVMKEMCVHLEKRGERCLSLCLEERDWLPGCPLIDNLSQSINRSKRTVFVLTSRYIKSGNFKTAFYMAQQRLMDEKDDVIVLIFLEKVPSNSKYLRLRKRLYKRSVLEWPTNPQAQPYFWFSLRSVLATESHKQYNNLFKETL